LFRASLKTLSKMMLIDELYSGSSLKVGLMII